MIHVLPSSGGCLITNNTQNSGKQQATHTHRGTTTAHHLLRIIINSHLSISISCRRGHIVCQVLQSLITHTLSEPISQSISQREGRCTSRLSKTTHCLLSSCLPPSPLLRHSFLRSSLSAASSNMATICLQQHSHTVSIEGSQHTHRHTYTGPASNGYRDNTAACSHAPIIIICCFCFVQ